MGLEVVGDKIETKVSAKRLWKALSVNAPHVLPKGSPEVIEKVVDEGDCLQVGSIRTIHFQKSFIEKKAKARNVDHISTYSKEKVLEIDESTRTVKVEIFEGGFNGVLVEKYYLTFHVEETGHDTSLVHWTINYKPLHNEHTNSIPDTLKENFTRGIRSIEAFLVSNHDY